MMEAVRTSETSVDNHFTRQYNPEDSSEDQHTVRSPLSVKLIQQLALAQTDPLFIIRSLLAYFHFWIIEDSSAFRRFHGALDYGDYGEREARSGKV
jgi:hypothetical protein